MTNPQSNPQSYEGLSASNEIMAEAVEALKADLMYERERYERVFVPETTKPDSERIMALETRITFLITEVAALEEVTHSYRASLFNFLAERKRSRD